MKDSKAPYGEMQCRSIGLRKERVDKVVAECIPH